MLWLKPGFWTTRFYVAMKWSLKLHFQGAGFQAFQQHQSMLPETRPSAGTQSGVVGDHVNLQVVLLKLKQKLGSFWPFALQILVFRQKKGPNGPNHIAIGGFSTSPQSCLDWSSNIGVQQGIVGEEIWRQGHASHSHGETEGSGPGDSPTAVDEGIHHHLDLFFRQPTFFGKTSSLGHYFWIYVK